MDFDFPDLNDGQTENEYIISKSKPVNLHLARMPENFKMQPNGDRSKDSTKINRNLQVKKQRVNEADPKEGFQFIMEDLDEVKKTGDNSGSGTRYIGKEVTQNQKFLVFYRKEKEIMLCGLSSTISFKKDQQLRSSTIEGIKGKRGGRQQGIKAFMRTSGKKEEEKEKERDKAKDDKDDDDSSSEKSWGDSGDSDLDEKGEKKNKAKKKKEASFMIRDIHEPEVPEPKKTAPVKENVKETKAAKQTVEKESDNSGGDKNDSGAESDSSFDFD